MRRALLVIVVGVLTYLALAVYSNIALVSIGYVEATVVVGCAMLVAYGVARIVSAYRAGRSGGSRSPGAGQFRTSERYMV